MFQRVAVGRVTQATRPDSSVVGFGFDANDNLASLTPPGKPAHGFAYTPVDLESEYAPPAAGLPDAKTQAFNSYQAFERNVGNYFGVLEPFRR